MCACVSPSRRLLVTSGVMWCDMDPICLVELLLQPYVATVAGIVSKHGLTIEAHCRNQLNKTKLVLYKPIIYFDGINFDLFC